MKEITFRTQKHLDAEKELEDHYRITIVDKNDKTRYKITAPKGQYKGKIISELIQALDINTNDVKEGKLIIEFKII